MMSSRRSYFPAENTTLKSCRATPGICGPARTNRSAALRCSKPVPAGSAAGLSKKDRRVKSVIPGKPDTTSHTTGLSICQPTPGICGPARTNGCVVSRCSRPAPAGSAAGLNKKDKRVIPVTADTTNHKTGSSKPCNRAQEMIAAPAGSAGASPGPSGYDGLPRDICSPRRKRDTTSHTTATSTRQMPRQPPNPRTIFASHAANDATTISPGFGATVLNNHNSRAPVQKGETTSHTTITSRG